MFDFLLIEQLTGKLAELLRYRGERDSQRFEIAVREVYTKSEAIHADYLTMFAAAIKDIEARRQPSLTAALIASSRLRCEPTRSTLGQLIESLRHDDRYSRYYRFMMAVASWFDIDDNTPSHWLFATLSKASPEQTDWASLEKHVRYVLMWQRTKWSVVAEEYAKAVVEAAR